MMIRGRWSSWSLFACAGLACTGGTETGNPPLTAEMSLVARTSDEGVARIGESRGGVGLESAWVSLDAVTLVTCGGSTDARVVIDARAVDLATPVPSSTIDLGGDPICRVDVDFARPIAPLPEGAPADLANATVVLAGTRADGVRFMLVTDRTRAVPLKDGDAPITLPEAGAGWIVAYDLAAWFAGLDLASATLEGDGTLRIDRDTNAALHDAFEARLSAAVSLHEDHDGDGELDPEDEAAIARPE